MSNDGQALIRRILQNSIKQRQRKNPQYSLNSLARDLKISSANLSEILRAKRRVSLKLAQRLASRLELSENEAKNLIETFSKPSFIEKIKTAKKLREVMIDKETLLLVTDWAYYGILALWRTRQFKNDVDWISRRLRLKPERVKTILKRLEKIGVLKRNSKGDLVESGETFITPENIPVQAIKKGNLSTLRGALASIEEDCPSSFHGSCIIACDPEKIPEAQAMLREFILQLSRYLGDSEKKEVFELSVSLFPRSYPDA